MITRTVKALQRYTMYLEGLIIVLQLSIVCIYSKTEYIVSFWVIHIEKLSHLLQ